MNDLLDMNFMQDSTDQKINENQKINSENIGAPEGPDMLSDVFAQFGLNLNAN